MLWLCNTYTHTQGHTQLFTGCWTHLMCHVNAGKHWKSAFFQNKKHSMLPFVFVRCCITQVHSRDSQLRRSLKCCWAVTYTLVLSQSANHCCRHLELIFLSCERLCFCWHIWRLTGSHEEKWGVFWLSGGKKQLSAGSTCAVVVVVVVAVVVAPPLPCARPTPTCAAPLALWNIECSFDGL